MTLRMRFAISLSLCVAVLAAIAPVASAKTPPAMPPRGKVLLGMGGHGITMGAFDRLTGAHHEIHLISPPWALTKSDGSFAFETFMDAARAGGYRIMVHLDAKDPRITPGAVARGAHDASLLSMGRVVNERNEFVYIRPPAEMNGHWSPWAAFTKSGSKRPAAYSTANYRRAFIRMAEVFHGGSVAGINARLRANGMPNLKTSDTALPSSGRVAMVWNPQAEGSPNVPGNQPVDFYPGASWVDYVATDIYEQSGKAAWAQNEAFYKRFSKAHPFMIAEYAPWGYDGASFVQRAFAWSRSHPRTVALMYFHGTSNPAFPLNRKPKALAAYKKLARAAVYRCPNISAVRATC